MMAIQVDGGLVNSIAVRSATTRPQLNPLMNSAASLSLSTRPRSGVSFRLPCSHPSRNAAAAAALAASAADPFGALPAGQEARAAARRRGMSIIGESCRPWLDGDYRTEGA